MSMYEDDYFEEDMVNAAEMAGHQTVGADTDTTEYVTDGFNPWGIKVGPGPTHEDEDPVNHPRHYGGFSNGAEVIDITENLTFNGGNCVKYVSRACRVDGRNKGNVREDIEKAIWYLNRELRRLGGADA